MRFGLGSISSGLLPAGSVARVGFNSIGGADPSVIPDGDIQTAFQVCLYEAGGFSEIQVSVQTPQSIFGYHTYITVHGRTRFDFADVQDFGGWVQERLQECFPQFQFTSRDPVIVESVPVGSLPGPNPNPGGAPARPDVRPTGTQSGKCPYPESAFCPCGQEWSFAHFGCTPITAQGSSGNVFDGLAKALGVTPTQAAIVGVLGALAVAVAVKRVL